ncbi:LysR family transcriptional regulator [Acidimangrovimonas sediminis]|uniref:LysR family transcriptional regulator n=1 Tax=Acidimangrovimonas sediminis TaxID=2056283 RepID=UPI000C7FB04A|nr:LysR family transcriptional regulator [Acidimangrovimonas sediminis]
MDLKQIRYFVGACEEGSFSAAAERLHCTASGVSQQMSALEDRLKTRLFERTRRGVVPNAAGRMFYDRCLVILRSVAEAEIELDDFHSGQSGSVSAGFVPGLAKSVLPQVLARFTREFPRVDINIGTGSADSLLEQLAAGELDFYVGQFAGSQIGLKVMPLGRFPVALISGRRLGMTPMRPLRLGQVAPLKLSLPSAVRSLRPQIESAIAAGEIAVERTLTIAELTAVLEFIAQTDWSTILPFWVGLKEIDNRLITVNPIVAPSMSLDLAMVHTLRQPLSRPAQLFFERFHEELARSEDDWLRLTAQP